MKDDLQILAGKLRVVALIKELPLQMRIAAEIVEYAETYAEAIQQLLDELDELKRQKLREAV